MSRLCATATTDSNKNHSLFIWLLLFQRSLMLSDVPPRDFVNSAAPSRLVADTGHKARLMPVSRYIRQDIMLAIGRALPRAAGVVGYLSL